MKRNNLIYLKHILESIGDIEKSVDNVLEKDFKKNKDIQDATIRRIEVIGEAVKNLSESFKKNHPNIEWRKIAGTRDVLIHAYFSVDIDLLWKIVEDDLIKLKKDVAEIIKKEEG